MAVSQIVCGAMLAVAPALRCESYDPNKATRTATTSSVLSHASADGAAACEPKQLEVIEHRRKNAQGEEVVTRYVKGRLLGKVMAHQHGTTS